ncbi:MAG: nuclear transport factor 2 family protein, partial [Acidobacteriia bacterium]|nr:nuclear transport factor 2 family protein [Terriglobia bacterium]
FPDVRLNKYTISEMEVRMVAANVGVLTYKVEVDATFQGQPIPGAARVSSVWVRQKGAWLMKFHQSTPIPK